MAVRPAGEPETPEKTATARQAIQAVLVDNLMTARDVSGRVGIAEKEVVRHLAHLERSLSRRGARLVSEPARCSSCGFAFAERDRFSKPGKCPQCRATRIEPARFTIDS